MFGSRGQKALRQQLFQAVVKGAVSHANRTTTEAVVKPSEIDAISVAARHRLGLVQLKDELKHTRCGLAQAEGCDNASGKHLHKLGVVLVHDLPNHCRASDFTCQGICQISP